MALKLDPTRKAKARNSQPRVPALWREQETRGPADVIADHLDFENISYICLKLLIYISSGSLVCVMII
jgi:hypothetical protein